MKAFFEWLFGPTIVQPVPKQNPNALRMIHAASTREKDPARPRVFEPALIQYSDAYRYLDSASLSPQQKHEWAQLRMQAQRHLLKLVQESRLRDLLILRGSMLMEMWFGPKARLPGDIDWVFADRAVTKDDVSAVSLFRDIKRLIAANPRTGPIEFEVDSILVDDIWMYERAHGRRMVMTWKAEGFPQGETQMDVAFGEETYLEPTPVMLTDSPGTLRAVSRELSLAWKLSWLISDQYPQGKDLFDATLLAESTTLPHALLEKVLSRCEGIPSPLKADFVMDLNVDWENFLIEYPAIEGTEIEWKTRLTRALQPTFAGR